METISPTISLLALIRPVLTGYIWGFRAAAAVGVEEGQYLVWAVRPITLGRGRDRRVHTPTPYPISWGSQTLMKSPHTSSRNKPQCPGPTSPIQQPNQPSRYPHHPRSHAPMPCTTHTPMPCTARLASHQIPIPTPPNTGPSGLHDTAAKCQIKTLLYIFYI